MSLFSYLILLLFLGLISGALARLLLPGPDPMGVLQTIGLGLGGNVAAGLILWALGGHGVPGLILSVLGSAVILYVIRRRRGGGLLRPFGPPQ